MAPGALRRTTPSGLRGIFGVPVDRLAERAPTDPRAGTLADIEALAAERSLPDAISITGLVYDVDTRRVELVERRSPLRAQ